jgi:hypothetical protein
MQMSEQAGHNGRDAAQQAQTRRHPVDAANEPADRPSRIAID